MAGILSIPRIKYLSVNSRPVRNTPTRIADVNCLTLLGDVMDDAVLLNPLDDPSGTLALWRKVGKTMGLEVSVYTML